MRGRRSPSSTAARWWCSTTSPPRRPRSSCSSPAPATRRRLARMRWHSPASQVGTNAYTTHRVRCSHLYQPRQNKEFSVFIQRADRQHLLCARFFRHAHRQEGLAQEVPGEEEEQAHRGRSVSGGGKRVEQACSERRRGAVAQRELRAQPELRRI
jgi:hypothetical protein